MKIVNSTLLALHILIGIGALAGGFAALSNPYAPMGAPVSMLEHSPFDSFFIPGLILCGFIGLGNIACAVAMKLRTRYQGWFCGVMGGGMLVWIIVQCIMIRGVVALHVIFFVFGAIQCVLALVLLYKENLFPMNIVKYILIKTGMFKIKE